LKSEKFGRTKLLRLTPAVEEYFGQDKKTIRKSLKAVKPESANS